MSKALYFFPLPSSYANLPAGRICRQAGEAGASEDYTLTENISADLLAMTVFVFYRRPVRSRRSARTRVITTDMLGGNGSGRC